MTAIRRMAAGDLEAVLAIVQESPEAPHWKPAAYEAFLGDGATEEGLLRTAFVAVSEERVIGFAAGSLLLDGEENRGELESMAVAPEARRRGTGTALLRGVLDWAAAGGAHHLGLEVRAGNGAAIRLYERLGLRREGRRPRYYSQPEEDALFMGTTVTPACAALPISTTKEVEGGLPRC